MGEASPEFFSYTSYYDTAKRVMPQRPDDRDFCFPSPVEFYNRLSEQGSLDKLCDGNVIRLAAMESDRQWYLGNKPYYKVYPAMVIQLLNATLSVKAEHLKLPHRTFAILFSHRHPFTCLPIHAVLVTALSLEEVLASGEDSDPLRKLTDELPVMIISLSQQFYHHGRKLAVDMSTFAIYKGQTLEEAIEAKPMGRIKRVDPDVQLAAPLKKRGEAILDVIRIVLAVALFGTSQHKLICPDLTRKQRKRYERAQQRNDDKAVARIAEKATGWTVGKDVILPNWAKSTGTDRPGIGHQRTHAHIRRGHVRMQPYGLNMSLRRLIYVAPTWVRPDLPVGPVRGYAIKEGG